MPAIAALAVGPALLSGCIHTYPSSGSVDPTVVEYDAELTLHYPDTYKVAGSEEGEYPSDALPLQRIAVEVMRDGRVITREELTGLPDPERHHLVVTPDFKLTPGQYTLLMWSDCAPAAEWESARYEHGDFGRIKACFDWGDYSAGNISHALRTDVIVPEEVSRGNGKVSFDLFLVSPMTELRIVMKDYSRFVREFKDLLDNADEELTLWIEYLDCVSPSFSIYDWRVSEPVERAGFIVPFPVTRFDDEVEIAADRVFIDPDAPLSLRISVLDKAGVVVARAESGDIDVSGGNVVKLEVDMLPGIVTGGITVNHVWDGEIDIDL